MKAGVVGPGGPSPNHCNLGDGQKCEICLATSLEIADEFAQILIASYTTKERRKLRRAGNNLGSLRHGRPNN